MRLSRFFAFPDNKNKRENVTVAFFPTWRAKTSGNMRLQSFTPLDSKNEREYETVAITVSKLPERPLAAQSQNNEIPHDNF